MTIKSKMRLIQPIFFLLMLVFIIFCNSPPKKEPLRVTNKADSVAISDIFQRILQPGANEDSLINIAKVISENDETLQDVVQYNILRNSILKGRLHEADSALQQIYAQYEADTTNYIWAKYLNLLASVSAYKNQQNDAVLYFQKALKLCETHNDKVQSATIRYNLANIFLSRTDYESAKEYGLQAHEILTETNDKRYLPLINGLLAVSTLHTKNDLVSAMKYAEDALAMSKETNNIQGFLLAYYAQGEILVKQEKFQDAIEPLKKAQELGRQFQQTQIILSTGASLLTCYLGLKEYRNGIQQGTETLELAQKTGQSDIEYSLYKNLGQCYSGLGDYKNAFAFTQQAEKLYREKSNVENQEVIQNLLISYESEKKNNIILQQENKLQRNHFQIITLLGISLLIATAGFLTSRIYKSRNRALRAQKEKEVLQALTDGEERERIRISGELHDGIGSQLTAIKLNLENMENQEINKQPIQMVRDVHRELRMVAHNIMPLDFETHSLAQGLQEFSARSNSEALKISFFSNAYDLKLQKNMAHSLYRAVQELVQNAIKHAQADSIYIQCLKGDDNLHISIEDDGIGIDEEKIGKSEGFRFLKHRLERLGADFELVSTKDKGTIARIILNLN